jgi:hypothetical protein
MGMHNLGLLMLQQTHEPWDEERVIAVVSSQIDDSDTCLLEIRPQ